MALPDDQRSGLLNKLVLLALELKVDLVADGVTKVYLAVDHVGPRWAVGVLRRRQKIRLSWLMQQNERNSNEPQSQP